MRIVPINPTPAPKRRNWIDQLAAEREARKRQNARRRERFLVAGLTARGKVRREETPFNYLVPPAPPLPRLKGVRKVRLLLSDRTPIGATVPLGKHAGGVWGAIGPAEIKRSTLRCQACREERPPQMCSNCTRSGPTPAVASFDWRRSRCFARGATEQCMWIEPLGWRATPFSLSSALHSIRGRLRCPRRRSGPGGPAGLQSRLGLRSGPGWVRLPLSSAVR
jgi:hypothetical protein